MGFWQIKLWRKILIAVFLAVIVILAVRFLSGPEDAWLCQNGEWVKHGQPGALEPTSGCGAATPVAEVILTEPRPNQQVFSPLNVSGQAKGGWYFEASFPFELVDEAGNVLAQSHAQAQSDWLTADFVPFKGELEYQLEATTTGKLIFKNDNPSGLPEKEKSFALPVIISPSRTMVIKIFFSNNNLDPGVSCDKVFAVERNAPATQAVARAALEQLLAGPTEQEKAAGYYTSINSGVKIQKLVISGGAAEADFDDRLEFQVGGSCRVAAIRAEIAETLKQFSTVRDVIISVNGRVEDVLQP